MDITELLSFAVQQSASDLHLTAGMPPMIRVDGDVRRIKLPALEHKQVHTLVYDIMNDKQRKEYEENLEVDFSFEVPNLSRFRVNAFNQHRGAAAVFRTVPNTVLTLDDLGMGNVFRELSEKPRGLVLVTGPTGSGKSTTLAAMIDYINDTRSDHILTIEDPIEFVHASKKCLINQREVHRDTHSFSNALRSALREDPDVILVGEMRDLETIRLALTAAETGHLVFGTLHTTSAAKPSTASSMCSRRRKKDMVRSMLSESLQGVISQTLLKKPKGGRVAAHEIMIGTPAVRNLIREDKVAQMYSAIQTGALRHEDAGSVAARAGAEGVDRARDGPRKGQEPQFILSLTQQEQHSGFYPTAENNGRSGRLGSVCHRRRRAIDQGGWHRPPVDQGKLKPSQARALVYSTMNDKQLAEFEGTNECNFAISAPGIGRFRVSAFMQRNTPGMVLRAINSHIPSLEELNLPPVLRELAMTKRGLILFVGGTSTGKSTSLASMIDYRNEHHAGHIITIEDPIEYIHNHKKSIVTQREVGIDTESFDVALKNTLRQAPDVILMGRSAPPRR